MVTKLLVASALILAGAAGPLVLDAGAQAPGMTGYGQSEGIEAAAASPPAGMATHGSTDAANAVTFRMRVENISSGNVLESSDGREVPFALAPGLWVVHAGDGSVFARGKLQAGRGARAAG